MGVCGVAIKVRAAQKSPTGVNTWRVEIWPKLAKFRPKACARFFAEICYFRKNRDFSCTKNRGAIFRSSFREKSRFSRETSRNLAIFARISLAKIVRFFAREAAKFRLNEISRRFSRFFSKNREKSQKTCAHFRSKSGQFWPNFDFPSVHPSRRFRAATRRGVAS